jgi:tRNA-specific 2-thiouridylase
MSREKVLIALSGGVDSAVAAAMLKDEGYHVEGFYMKQAFSGKSEAAARSVADTLHIPLHVMDVTVPFRTEIIDYFLREYLSGRTPNPCVLCNKKIKFLQLMKEAEYREFDYIATGHYARIENLGEDGGYRIRRGCDTKKDQSYFLSLLGQKELQRIIFPLGRNTKEAVKKMAAAIGFGSIAKEESQETCFVPDNYRIFIENYAGEQLPQPGDIVTTTGRIVGKHRGIHTLTIGQRKGLDIASDRPYYVLEIRKDTNEVVVGRNEDQFFDGLVAKDISWVSPSYRTLKDIKAQVHIRYRHRGVNATIKNDDPDGRGRSVPVTFETPQKAVAPGQAAVFYEGDIVIGAGWIERGIKRD